MDVISTQQAKKQGLTYYFTGNLCKKGHISKRFVVSSVCYECHQDDRVRAYNTTPDKFLEKSKLWYQKNKEQHNQRGQERFQRNRDQHREKAACYYQNNKKHILKKNAVWAKAHPEKSVEYHYKRKLRIPSWAKDDPRIAKLYQKCKELNTQWNTNFEVDHVIPLRGKTVSGLHVFENLQLLDRIPNTKKGNRYAG